MRHGKRYNGAMFDPRAKTESRSEILPQVRVSAEEKAAVEWLAVRLSEKDGIKYSLSDVVRVALADLYKREQG